MKLEMQLSAPLMAAFILGKMLNRPFRYANLSREIDNFKKMKMGKKMLVIFFKYSNFRKQMSFICEGFK